MLLRLFCPTVSYHTLLVALFIIMLVHYTLYRITKMNPNMVGNRMRNATSPRPSTKVNRNENRPITLADIKSRFLVKILPF